MEEVSEIAMATANKPQTVCWHFTAQTGQTLRQQLDGFQATAALTSTTSAKVTEKFLLN